MIDYEKWEKKTNLILTHKFIPDTKVELVPAETGRSGKHFIVRVNGEWIYQKKFIKSFWELSDALAAAEKKCDAIINTSKA